MIILKDVVPMASRSAMEAPYHQPGHRRRKEGWVKDSAFRS